MSFNVKWVENWNDNEIYICMKKIGCFQLQKIIDFLEKQI